MSRVLMLINKMALPRKKHYHILEVILGYLANAQMPLKFKDEVLEAKYLINMLPSIVINNDTHVHCLLGTRPDYTFLCVFGCACWPNLRPNNKHKLDFRSKKCLFWYIVLAIKVLNP
jgi:histone deacetylase 1/2